MLNINQLILAASHWFLLEPCLQSGEEGENRIKNYETNTTEDAKELKSNFSKPNHKDINTVNSNKKVKTKPKTITKLSKTKHNKFKPNHKAKPKPLASLIIL